MPDTHPDNLRSGDQDVTSHLSQKSSAGDDQTMKIASRLFIHLGLVSNLSGGDTQTQTKVFKLDPMVVGF